MASGAKVLVSGHIDVSVRDLGVFVAALGEHIRLSRAEPGCLVFEIAPTTVVANGYIVAETFVDQWAFDAHKARTRGSDWWEKTRHIARHLTQSKA